MQSSGKKRRGTQLYPPWGMLLCKLIHSLPSLGFSIWKNSTRSKSEEKKDRQEVEDNNINSSTEDNSTPNEILLQKLNIDTGTNTCNNEYYEHSLISQDSSKDSARNFSRSRNLMDLPPELILLIFSYLNARFTLKVLCRVCTFFNQLLSPEATWKTHFGLRWPKRDRKEDYDYVTSWKKVCVDHEDMEKFWKSPSSNFDFYQLKKHFAPVDAAIVMAGGRLCASGARDRSVAVWNLSSLKRPGDENDALVHHLDGHKGWVWCLDSDPTGSSRICSGSWDNSVKIWDLQSNTVEMTTIREHRAAVLCVDWQQDVLVTGCQDKRVRMFDLRDNRTVGDMRYHTKAVLCLSVDDHFIITGSEDETMCVYDRRACSVFKVLPLKSPAFCICRTSSAGYNYLRLGGRAGHIFLVDTTADSFEIIEPISDVDDEVGLQGKICGMCYYGGAIVASSSDHSIKVLGPSRIPNKIFSFDVHSGDVASVYSKCGVLASASSDMSVGIWRPKHLRPTDK